MSIPIDADYLIDTYKAGKTRYGTWHRGVGSRDVEIEVFKLGMKRGDYDYIIVHDRNDARNSFALYPDGRKVSL